VKVWPGRGTTRYVREGGVDRRTAVDEDKEEERRKLVVFVVVVVLVVVAVILISRLFWQACR